jgi:hypothetical protein
MNIHRTIAWVMSVTTALVLAGCVGSGRGGGATPTAPRPGATQGVWLDSSSDFVAVLNDGSIWGLLNTNNTGNNNAADGDNISMIHSSAGTVTVFPVGTASHYSTPIAASVTAQQTLNIVPSTSPEVWSFNGNYLPGYNTPASLSQIQGIYSGYAGVTRAANTVQVNVSGSTITLTTTQHNCSASGRITPQNDMNVFSVTMVFQGNECALGNGVRVSGIVLSESSELLILSTTGDQKKGFLFAATH